MCKALKKRGLINNKVSQKINSKTFHNENIVNIQSMTRIPNNQIKFKNQLV